MQGVWKSHEEDARGPNGIPVGDTELSVSGEKVRLRSTLTSCRAVLLGLPVVEQAPCMRYWLFGSGRCSPLTLGFPLVLIFCHWVSQLSSVVF